MHRADQQRPARERPRADVNVRRRAFVHVRRVAVMVDVRGAVGPLPHRGVDRADAEADQHQRHAEFEAVGRAHRHLGAQDHQHRADDEQCGRVAEAPADAEERRLVAVAFAGDERRHRGEMIRFERMAHPEQRAEAGAGDEFEHWHDADADILSQEFLMIWLAVAAGGALGSMARHGVNIFFGHVLERATPYATAAMNRGTASR